MSLKVKRCKNCCKKLQQTLKQSVKHHCRTQWNMEIIKLTKGSTRKCSVALCYLLLLNEHKKT